MDRSDTAAALALLRQRPLQNVFLQHLVESGLLGSIPGFFGYDTGGRLGGLLFIGPQGGLALEVQNDEAFRFFASCARLNRPSVHHVVGFEEVTEPFWSAFVAEQDELIWERREPVYQLERGRLGDAREREAIEPAGTRDLDEIVENSAQQHIEDLQEDRRALDPEAFRRNHLGDLRAHRWWVIREAGRICFQAHVGPENAETVQIGGVFTAPEFRRRGLARRGVESISRRLLERRPSVVLFCDESNKAARNLYEALGYEVIFYNRSYLVRSLTG